MLRIANLLPQLGADLVNIDGIVTQEHFLLFVNADHQALFGDLFDCAGFGYGDFNA